VKAYPYGTDDYVELDQRDLAQLQVANDKTIRLERFFHPDRFELELLGGRSLHLAPAHAAAQRHYQIVLKALGNKRAWGLGHVVFSGRRQLVIVRPGRRALMLHVLVWPAQRRALVQTDNRSADVAAKDVKPIERVIGAANGPVVWSEYRDDSESKLAALVEAKRAAGSKGRILPINKKPSRNGSPARSTRKNKSRKTKRAAKAA